MQKLTLISENKSQLCAQFVVKNNVYRRTTAVDYFVSALEIL